MFSFFTHFSLHSRFIIISNIKIAFTIFAIITYTFPDLYSPIREIPCV